MLKISVIILLCMLAVFIINMLYAVYKNKREGKHIGKSCREPKKDGILKRILVFLPQRIIDDMYNRQDYEFLEQGFHLFVGEQGSGKTISLVYTLLRMKKKYPKLKVRTNMGYANEDGPIKNWKDLVFKNNGIYGQIDVIDEVQNWFNSLQSKDFPPEMFSEISQQRKQRKCIYGTSQVWGRVAKPIREQVAFVYMPTTLFGCLTILRKYKPSIDNDGSIDNLKFRSVTFFVHNDEIRNAFDTYKKIQVQSLKGYKSEQYQLRVGSVLPTGSDEPRVVGHS